MTQRANVTLLFLRSGDQILLAMKKRRFGAGKWNGVGGKVEAGETYEQAAIRECQEEIGVTPKHIRLRGELHFFDLPDVEHYCHVFEANEWEGDPVETEEMRPQWFHIQDIPFSHMWADDEFWMPKFLSGVPFKGKVVIVDDKIKECMITEVTTLANS